MRKAFIVIPLLSAACWLGCISPEDQKATGPKAPGAHPGLEADSKETTSIQWLDSVQNIGKVLEGKKVEVLFHFINSGAKPLVIKSATPSCGCTVPVVPEAPIAPGKEGVIKAVFDSQGRMGTNHKTITVVANTGANTGHILSFDVEVISTKEGPKAANTGTSTF